MYALIEFAGKQYKIEEGSLIKVPRINEKVGSKVSFDKVLYFDDGKNRHVGNPLINGKKIEGKIASHGRERKIIVFKFKRRKGHQKKNTHRQEFTMLSFDKLSTVKKVSSTKTNQAKTATTKTAVKKVSTKKSDSPKSVTKKTVAKKQTPKKKTTATKKEK